jgi:hypothetical protein
MPTMPKLILAALLRGLPFVIIIVSSGIYAVKRKSILGAMLALGCIAIAIPNIFSIFAHIYIRTHSVEDYGRLMMPISVSNIAGWYTISIVIAAILIDKLRKSDNNALENSV